MLSRSTGLFNHRHPLRSLLVGLGSSAILIAPSAMADRLWSGNVSSDWSDPQNWIAPSVPGSGDVVAFQSSPAHLWSNQDVEGLEVKGLDYQSGVVSGVLGGSEMLTLGASGITVNASAGDQSITAPLHLGAGQAWNIGAERTLTVSGVISGGDGAYLLRSGSGTLVLTGANTYTGQTFISGGGTIEFNTIGNIGAGPSALGNPIGDAATIWITGSNNGRLKYTGSGHSTNRDIAIGVTAILEASGIGQLHWTGDVSRQGGGLVLTGTGDGRFSGTLNYSAGSGAFNITKTGSGTWTLDGSSNFGSGSGSLSIFEGTVIIGGDVLSDADSPIGKGTGPIVMGSSSFSTAVSTILLNGAYTFGRQITSDIPGRGSKHVIGATNTSGTAVFNTIDLRGTATELTAAEGGTVQINRLRRGSGNDAAHITKTGGGTLVLKSGESDFASFTVAEGTVLLDSADDPTVSSNPKQMSAPITVNSGTTFGGHGISRAATVFGTLSPGGVGGSQTGIMAFHNAALTLKTGSTLAIDLNGLTPGSEYDQIFTSNSSGPVTIEEGVTLTLSLGFAPPIDSSFRILELQHGSAVQSGFFSNLPDAGTIIAKYQGLDYVFQADYGANDLVLRLTEVVPEPGALSVLGLAALGLVRRSRKN